MSPDHTPISVLPPLYARWIDALLEGPIPAETDATCEDCAMCRKDTTRTSASVQFFDPKLQCCTFFPELPNFLVGGILGDPDFEGSVVHAMVSGRNIRGELVTPLGISPPMKHTILYTSAFMAFGKDASLRCPYHMDATAERGPGCGIWKHRQSMCTTWFCKFVRGKVGADFWADLHKLLQYLEETLRWWCVMGFDFPPETVRHLYYLQKKQAGRVETPDAGRLDEEVNAERYAVLWERYRGNEAGFFRDCARRVGALTWDEIRGIAGPELQVHARLLRARYDELVGDDIPANLRVGGYQVVHSSPQTTTVVSYSPLDPVELPNTLFQLLPYFDGRPTLEALEAIRANHNLSIAPRLVQKLVDYTILAPAT